MKEKFGRRILSAIMAGIMTLGMAPTSAFAANTLPDEGTLMYAGVSKVEATKDDEYISINMYCPEVGQLSGLGYTLQSGENGNPVTMILMNRGGTTHTGNSNDEPFPVYCLDKELKYPAALIQF